MNFWGTVNLLFWGLGPSVEVSTEAGQLHFARTQEAYAYTSDNPSNLKDPTGLFGWNDLVNGAKKALHAALDIAAVPPYATYLGSYTLMKSVNDWGDQHGLAGKVFSRIVTAPFTAPEAAGLAGDVVIDWIKGHTVNQESIADEGNVGYLYPLHDYVPARFKGPKTYLPGIHSDCSVDWEW